MFSGVENSSCNFVQEHSCRETFILFLQEIQLQLRIVVAILPFHSAEIIVGRFILEHACSMKPRDLERMDICSLDSRRRDLQGFRFMIIAAEDSAGIVTG
jgi:hypothetical protein